MNNKGQLGDYMWLGVFIFMMCLFALAVATAAFLYFGSYDTKLSEARVLNYKLRECIKENGFNENSFYSDCGIDKKIFEQYFILRVEKDGKKVFSWANPESCKFKQVVNVKSYPRCDEKTFISKGVKYTLLTGSNQNIRRANE